jgi:hypothetical protein
MHWEAMPLSWLTSMVKGLTAWTTVSTPVDMDMLIMKAWRKVNTLAVPVGAPEGKWGAAYWRTLQDGGRRDGLRETLGTVKEGREGVRPQEI